jgi:hypothetical protein
MKKDITYIKRGSPRWEELAAQWDDEYCLPKKAADELRKRGVPPPPKPKPEASGQKPEAGQTK